MTLVWWLVGAAVVWTLLTNVARLRGLVPEYVRVRGPLCSIRTAWIPSPVRRLAAFERGWRVWGTFGVVATFLLMAAMGLFLVVVAGVLLTHPAVTTNASGSTLPTDFDTSIPLASVIVAFTLALVGHELGHAVVCLVEDIDVDAVGIGFVVFVPRSVFVAPDYESRERASPMAQLRLFAAGVANNVALGAVALAVLFGPLTGAIAPVAGVPVAGVAPGSPADGTLHRGDVVTAVEGHAVRDEASLSAALDRVDDRRIRLSLADGRTISVRRTALDDPRLGIVGYEAPPVVTGTRYDGVRGLVTRIGWLVSAPTAAVSTADSRAGFLGVAGPLTSFYVPRGPLAVLGSGVFVLVNVAFWTAWFCLVLGTLNALPIVLLDGGHLIRVVFRTVAAALPVSDPEFVAALGVLAVSAVTVLSFVVIVVVP
ncbi:MAG: site-2 protease family protein [Haloarculaceae archaeon]